MCRLICNLPELNIRICDPKFIPLIFIKRKLSGLKILISYAVKFFATLNNSYKSDRTLLLWIISNRELKILIFHAVKFFAALNNSCKSDRILVLWINRFLTEKLGQKIFGK